MPGTKESIEELVKKNRQQGEENDADEMTKQSWREIGDGLSEPIDDLLKG